MKIGIQGNQGSYHEKVAKILFPQANIEYIDSFNEVHTALLDKNVIDKAIVAIANNRYGFIQESYSELIDHADSLLVSGEYTLAIKHQLLAKPGTPLDSIKAIYSQNAAIGQCHKFLDSNFNDIDLIEYKDTAAAAQLVADHPAPGIAAIASIDAANIYGLDIIAENIQDDTNNLTRFLVIEKKKAIDRPGNTSHSIAILTTSQTRGSLATVLNIFLKHDINISTLHSSFIPNTDFQMKFLIEFDAGNINNKLNDLTVDIKLADAKLDIIGSYLVTSEQETSK